jgi:hypothetical protein
MALTSEGRKLGEGSGEVESGRDEGQAGTFPEGQEVFRHFTFQTVDRLISQVNPILRGWVDYFWIGYSRLTFGYIKDWVEKKTGPHLLLAVKRHAFGWNR